MYLYRAVDLEGHTIDFYLSESRGQALFKKALAFSYVSEPRFITVDKNPTYTGTIRD